MNQGIARRSCTTGRLMGALLFSSVLLAACGGSDAPVPDEDYVTWSSNANGVVIKDYNNESFAVRRDTRALAYYVDDRVLTGLTVVGANILNNGVSIGTVTYTTSVSGNQITDMTCLNGRDLDITMTSNSWSYRCV